MDGSLTETEMEQDTLMLKADGSFISRSSKLKEIVNLNEYFLACPGLEEYSIATGRMLESERANHQQHIRRVALFAQTYPWPLVIRWDNEFRRHLHAGRLALRWRDEAVALVLQILMTGASRDSAARAAAATAAAAAADAGGGDGGGAGRKGKRGQKRKAAQQAFRKAKYAAAGVNLADGRAVCFNHNRAAGCSGKLKSTGAACPRAHVCLHCGEAGHVLADCTSFSG